MCTADASRRSSCRRGRTARPSAPASSSGRAGFRRARSHASIAVDDCLVAHPLLVAVDHRGAVPGRERGACCAAAAEPVSGSRRRRPSRRRSWCPTTCARDFIHEEAAGRRVADLGGVVLSEPRRRGRRAGRPRRRAPPTSSASPTTALDLYSGVGLFAGRARRAGLVGDRGRVVEERGRRRAR